VARFLIFLTLSFLVGCEFQQKNQPSVLVIAVEGLNFESLTCDSDEANDRTYEGIRAFCEESVRFSHAYAPSTLSQSTMASLMTGLNPFDHQVRNNGSDFLSARFRTLAEGALSKGYRTVFVTGGAPIWRKSGLAQGFEVFDDTMDISAAVPYRSSEEVLKIGMNWIDHESASTPFLGVFFLNDLQFPQIATRTKEGEVREKSTDAQVEETAESLGGLVNWLKKKHRWNSTNIVLVGMNSHAHSDNQTEPNPLSLKSPSVQVTLFIKPARREGDNVIQWAVDRNVSLVDVGKTMFGWLGLEAPHSSIPELEPVDLSAALKQASPDWKEDRLILSETAWPDWLEGAGVRWAIRQNHLLYINDEHPRIYNTLTDRLEVSPLRQSDPLWISSNEPILNLLKTAKVAPWKGMHGHWPEQIAVAQELWLNNSAMRHAEGRESWSKWYLRYALNGRDWREVKRLAQEAGDPIGSYVAAKHLNESIPLPRNPCLRLLINPGNNEKRYFSECEDERLLALRVWQTAKTDEEKNLAQEKFLRLYALQTLDQQIGRLNFLNELTWDVDREDPEGPQLIDYVLTLKEFEPFAKKTSALVGGKDLTL